MRGTDGPTPNRIEKNRLAGPEFTLVNRSALHGKGFAVCSYDMEEFQWYSDRRRSFRPQGWINPSESHWMFERGNAGDHADAIEMMPERIVPNRWGQECEQAPG